MHQSADRRLEGQSLTSAEIIAAIEQRRAEIDARAKLRRREAAARQLLEEMRSIYEATGNALVPWFALRYCGKIGWPLPDWVMAYLMSGAEGLEKLVDRPPADLRNEVAEILGFRAESKSENPFWAFREAREAQAMFADYLEARDRGLTQTAAINEVAAQRSRTIHTVRRRLQYHAQAVLGESAGIADLEEQRRDELEWLAAMDVGRPG